MAPPVKPRFRTIPIAILSSAQPDAVAVAQRGDTDRFQVEHSLLEPESQYPFLLSALTSLTTEFAAALPKNSPQKKRRQSQVTLHEPIGTRSGFTLTDGSWWYRIISNHPKDQTEVQTEEDNQDGRQKSMMSLVRQNIDAVLWESLTEVAADLTLSFWKDWKILDCPMAFDLLMAELFAGVKWSKEDNVLVLFIHNLQKRRDQSEIHFFLRRQSGFPLKLSDPQLPHLAPVHVQNSEENAPPSDPPMAPTTSAKSTPSPTTPPPSTLTKDKPTPYIPPHRHRQSLYTLPPKPPSPHPHPLRSNPTLWNEPPSPFPGMDLDGSPSSFPSAQPTNHAHPSVNKPNVSRSRSRGRKRTSVNRAAYGTAP